MKTKVPKYIRRTPAELKQFKAVVAGYVADGYPTWYAEQCAWDILYTERNIRKSINTSKVAA